MEDTKSVYKYAAEAGVPMGLYLTAMSACLLLSLRLPQLPVLMFPLLFGLPFFTAWLLRRIASDAPHYNKVSALWLAGIYTFIFGSLICCLGRRHAEGNRRTSASYGTAIRAHPCLGDMLHGLVPLAGPGLAADTQT